MFKRVAASAIVVASALIAVFAAATPAQATSFNGCAYPRVCFYKTSTNWDNGTPTAAYQDVTSGYQTLGSNSAGSYYVYNTRNDDVAYIRFSTGRVRCFLPNHGGAIGEDGYATGIRISSSSTC